ncbi:hypothetical protein [Desulfovirgula thermocuniculi]|uniref:hypothetical protein n=1 Tax=Desulfovirgula thermocuniculi TaxID=348842 RepID=UPI0003FAA48C|nr:hypothetical protein [Desulfovirgula thermocuniculi]
MDALHMAAKKLIERLGPEEALRAAREIAGADRARFREALGAVREALAEAEALAAGRFGYAEACRAAGLLEGAVHRVRCAANSLFALAGGAAGGRTNGGRRA